MQFFASVMRLRLVEQMPLARLDLFNLCNGSIPELFGHRSHRFVDIEPKTVYRPNKPAKGAGT